uniref:Uncharacterized protein n=1 Tax=Cannabis sativa TaxID=3483 RepID=A0A803PTA1_CANSA
MVEVESSKKPRRVDTPAVSSHSGIPPEAEEYLVPPGIILSPVPADEERQQLRIAKHHYAMAEYTRGNTEVEALKKETGHLSKTLIDHGYIMSEFGGMDEAMKSLRDFGVERKAFREEAQEKEAQAERRHQEALKAKAEELRAKDDALKAWDEAVTK